MHAFIISLCFYLLVHPIHISKCTMEVNPENYHMEVVAHVYIDDLQEVIEKSGAPALKLATEHEHESADSFIMSYLKQNFIISNGDKTVDFEWVGKEQSDDLVAFWCYLETDLIDETQEMSIKYSVLQDLYADQQNIVFIKFSSGKEEYFLSRPGDNELHIN